MTIAYLDEHVTGRQSAPRLRVAHAPRRAPVTRVARVTGRAAASCASADVAVVRPVSVGPVSMSPVSVSPASIGHIETRDRIAVVHSRRLRLTPRGRLVFGGLLVVLALLVFSLGRFSAGANASGPPQHVTVSSGDTLWSIAEHAAPTADPRVEVERIISSNHLASGAALTPGDVLLVP